MSSSRPTDTSNSSSSSSSSSSSAGSRPTPHGCRLSQQLFQQVMDIAGTPAAAVTAPGVLLDATALQQLQECSRGLPAVSIGLSAMPRPLQHGCQSSLQQQQQEEEEKAGSMQGGTAGGLVGRREEGSCGGSWAMNWAMHSTW
jgi:hypothetical protein